MFVVAELLAELAEGVVDAGHRVDHSGERGAPDRESLVAVLLPFVNDLYLSLVSFSAERSVSRK